MSKEYLGLIVSPECATHPADVKRWFHFGRFVAAYEPVLSRYRLIAPRDTVDTIQNLGVNIDVEPLGDGGFEGTVRLAARVARGQIGRVLMFQDPSDLAIERPHNYALLRNCNLRGAHLLINVAAHLWALYEASQMGCAPGKPYSIEPIRWKNRSETVAFIAHDEEKPRMGRFALHFRHVLKKFRMIGTSGTVAHITKHLKEHVPPSDRLSIEVAGADKEGAARSAHGPAGGDVVIAEEIFDYHGEAYPPDLQEWVFHHVLFFVDHKHTHPHEPDIQVLLKTCVNPLHRVNLILNSRMAEEWANRYVAKS